MYVVNSLKAVLSAQDKLISIQGRIVLPGEPLNRHCVQDNRIPFASFVVDGAVDFGTAVQINLSYAPDGGWNGGVRLKVLQRLGQTQRVGIRLRELPAHVIAHESCGLTT